MSRLIVPLNCFGMRPPSFELRREPTLPTAANTLGPAVRLLPAWVQGYERAWLVPDLLAGVIVWSVVMPLAPAGIA